MKKSILLSLFALTMAACGGSDDESSVDSLSKPVAINAGQGLKCIKSTGRMHETTYLGVIDVDGNPITAIRNEQSMSMEGKKQPAGVTVQHSDGKDLTLYMTIGQDNKAGIKQLMKEGGDDYPPSDWDQTAMMAEIMYGKCTSWVVDESLLGVPQGVAFDTSIGDIQHALEAMGESAEGLAH